MKQIILTVFVSIVLTFVVICMVFFNSNNIEIGEKIDFQTKNGEFVFTAIPSKGRDYKMLEDRFNAFKKAHPENEELKLYRTTSRNYLDIGKWGAYRIMPEWNYPYLPFWKR